MLVLTRKVGERIAIGENQEVVVTVVAIHGGRVRLGFEADASIPIHRIEPDKLIPTELGHQIRETHHVVGLAH